MKNRKLKLMLTNLKDDRSFKVMFVPHCILNENTRYWGGAFKSGINKEVINDLISKDVGVIQMKCPGMYSNGILRQKMIVAFEAKKSIIYYFLRLILPIVIIRNKFKMYILAKDVVKEIAEYIYLGFKVVGFVGITGSPFCSISKKLDFIESFDYAASIDLKKIDRTTFNQEMSKRWIRGEAWFISAIKKGLNKKEIKLDFYELDLADEKKGKPMKMKFME